VSQMFRFFRMPPLLLLQGLVPGAYIWERNGITGIAGPPLFSQFPRLL